jgi:hypothetical protein
MPGHILLSMQPKPVSTTTENKRRRLLKEDFVFTWEVEGTTYRVEVPAGYDYEVSGPLVSQIILIAAGPYYAGEDVSLGHDWGYRFRGKVDAWAKEGGQWYPLRRPLTKREIDEIMRSDPEDPHRVQELMYQGVRLFGWWKWYDWDQWASNKLNGLLDFFR